MCVNVLHEICIVGAITGWDHDNGPPLQQWEKATADAAFMPRTWGLKVWIWGQALRAGEQNI